MQLRHKFSLVALAYLLALAVNLVVACWCILVYFNSAFGAFEEALAAQSVVDEVRSRVRDQGKLLSEMPGPAGRAALYHEAQRQIEGGLSRLAEEGRLPEHLRSAIDGALLRKSRVVAAYLDPDEGTLLNEADTEVFQALDRALGLVSHSYRREREAHLQRAARVADGVVTLLVASTLAGAALCLAGLVAMYRWVVRPVHDLRLATREISQGRFDHRVPTRGADELGELAAEVNQMSGMIVDMQRRLVDRERLAAAGETVTRVAHNIRNPLSGIRTLAEAAMQRTALDAETVDYLRRIIDSVDRFEHWLRDIQQSLAPLSLNTSVVDPSEMVTAVAAVLDGMLLRRSVSLDVDISPLVPGVRVDPLHFEQALVALVTNAIQASPPGERVRICVHSVNGSAAEWQLVVADRGGGISPEFIDKIFSPYFTTKADGTGMGLAIAQKVVRLHGGELKVESRVGEGTRFIAIMPGMVTGGFDGGHPDHRR